MFRDSAVLGITGALGSAGLLAQVSTSSIDGASLITTGTWGAVVALLLHLYGQSQQRRVEEAQEFAERLEKVHAETAAERSRFVEAILRKLEPSLEKKEKK